MSKKIEELLKERLSVIADENFSKTFFNKFDAEFGHEIKTQKTQLSWLKKLTATEWLKPMMLTACLLVIIVVGVNTQQKEKINIEHVTAMSISPMLEDLDMLAQMDNVLNQGMLELSDEEWEVLLEEQS
jgi:hypothetical protein